MDTEAGVTKPLLRPASRMSVTPERLREMLRLPTARLVQMVTHTESRDTSPLLHDNSTPSLRSITGSISALTARENSRLEVREQTHKLHIKPITHKHKSPITASHLPAEEDFKRVLDRLNRITARGGPQDPHFTLYEGKSSVIVLESDERAYGKLSLKGMKSPVSIRIKRASGRLHTFLSRTAMEPQEDVCDLQFRGDTIEFSDTGVHFKSLFLYIGFHALETTEFVVYIHFGRLKTMKSSIKPSDDANSMLSLPIVTTYKSKPVIPGTDYVKLNMRTSASVDRLQERRAISEERRRVAKAKRMANISARKSWALLQLRRREIKAEELAKAQSLFTQKMMLERAQKGFLLTIIHAYSLNRLNTVLISHYKTIKEAQIQDQKVRLIQRFMGRKLFLHRVSTHMVLTRALNDLRMYLPLISDTLQLTARKHILDSVFMGYERAMFKSAFGQFFERVVKVQAAVRMGNAVRRYRLEKMHVLWGETVAVMVAGIGHHHKAGKKAKKGKNPPTALMSIPMAHKQQVLIQHYAAARKVYSKEFATFRDRRSRGLEAAFPVFTYLPDKVTMKKLIEKAVQYASSG